MANDTTGHTHFEVRPQSIGLILMLSRESGMSPAQVVKDVRKLIAHGLLRVLPRAGPGGTDSLQMTINGKPLYED